MRAPHRPYEQGPFTRAKEATEEEVARCLQMDGGVCVELGIQYEDLVGFAIECAEVLITAYEKKGKGDRIASIVTGKGNATGAGKYMVSGKTLKSAGAKHVEKWLTSLTNMLWDLDPDAEGEPPTVQGLKAMWDLRRDTDTLSSNCRTSTLTWKGQVSTHSSRRSRTRWRSSPPRRTFAEQRTGFCRSQN